MVYVLISKMYTHHCFELSVGMVISQKRSWSVVLKRIPGNMYLNVSITSNV